MVQRMGEIQVPQHWRIFPRLRAVTSALQMKHPSRDCSRRGTIRAFGRNSTDAECSG